MSIFHELQKLLKEIAVSVVSLYIIVYIENCLYRNSSLYRIEEPELSLFPCAPLF